MIISHAHKFIFVAVPKTGTHSVREALRPHLGEADEEQAHLFVEKKLSNPELAALRHGHISLAELRPHIDPAVFESYFKFAFVRNPFDRFVSFCAFVTRREGDFERDAKRVMRHFLFAAPPMKNPVFKPQHHFLVGADGELLTDFIGRVENSQTDYDAVCARLGLPSTELERKNSSQHADYRSYYDQQLIDGVAKLFGRDLELFGYDF
jgi:hypothetical protein